jgi:phage tail tape-measure protein
MSDLTTSININAGGNFTQQMRVNEQRWKRFSKTGRNQMTLLNRSVSVTARGLDKLGNRYTAILSGAGAAYLSTRTIMDSAQLDKRLIQIRQTAGATQEMANQLREDILTMSRDTGQPIESLLGGFNNLIQSGMEWQKARVTINAINAAMAVTGSNAQVLSASLSVAAETFDFDLSKPEVAVQLLDQMTTAGRLGNAELEDLSSIFARVGVNAKAANLSFTDTLGFIEQLSKIERQPERLATLVDSTLLIFTNQKYLEKAAKVTGVSFYDEDKQRRAAFDVLEDIAKKYRQLNSDIDKDQALAAAFEGVDQDTLKGLRNLLNGEAIPLARQMGDEIAKSTGTIVKDLEDALDNSVDQVARLKSALTDAADGFVQPINDALGEAIKWMLDTKKLTGEDLLLGAGAAGLLGYGSIKGADKLLNKAGGLGKGVVVGKALEETTGVQPVYVVNMPGSGFGGKGAAAKRGGFKHARKLGKFESARAMSSIKQIPKLGLAATGTAGLAVAGAGLAGYGAGTAINKTFIEGTEFQEALGRSIAKALALFGNDNAQAALNAEQRSKLQIEVTDNRIAVKNINSPNMDIDVDSGLTLGAL